MSKKMWQKIFKSKAQKPPPLAKINKRHSRIVYEEYQQLSDLLAGGKEQLSSSNEKENEHENGNGNGPACGNGNGNGSINVFEQPPPQSSFNSSEFGEQHQPKQQLSTFSRVRNTFSIRRSSNSNSNNNSNSSKKLANATPTTSSTTDRDQEDSGRGAEDEEPLPPPPPPLTSGSALPVPEHVPDQAVQLTPCPCCSRTFVVDALRKHIVICEKASKKRKIFDSSRQRRDGTALSTYVLPKNFGLPNAERTAGVPSPPANAREAPPAEPVNSPQPVRRKSQTELVRSTARASLRKAASTLSNTAANEAAGSGGPAGPPAAPPAREKSLAERIKPPPGDPCPHCERTFNPKAFDRHVEWCKEKTMLANMKGANKQETSKAKERLEARKKYKPPNLKTKRSVARDKYSGNHEELLEAGEMAAPKPSMMSLSMTSSVQSDNHQAQGTRSRAPVPPGSRGKPETRPAVSQNQVNLYMTHDEDPPSSPPPPSDGAPLRRSRRKQPESCCEIDDAMERLRHNGSGDGFRLAKLDCMEAPALQPARHRKTTGKRDKIGAGDKDIRLPNLPQVTMTFDELNGLIKRKGGTPICNMEMEDQEKHHHSSTSLVRQAHRRTRTRENPNLELRALQQGSVMSKDVQFASLDSSLVPLQRKQRKVVHSGSEEDSPRAEIQIKMEATTMRTVCRPTKRPAVHGGQLISNPEPLRALPMPELKQSLEAINKSMGQAVLPRLKLGNEREDLESDADEQDNYTSELDDEPEEEDDLIARATKLIERARSCPSPKPNPSAEDTHSGDEEQEEEEEQPDLELEKVLKLPPLTKQNSNVSRRLVVLEQDENGTMYIKSATSSQRRANSGLGNKYDPFLSAKRQLEELCSPSTPPPEEEEVTSTTRNTKTLTPLPTTTPTATPNIAMTTSLNTAISKPAQMALKSTPASNFRRTSSLRGPRRTPMLNSRPLFATNYRPTIQRGLSDEGPISTNFLKPEEFDEMPVRAACGNDFHSPRVVRRDTSASNRKQQLKLPVGGAGEASNAPSSPQAGRSVAKTDSLAVFLKYEHELEQLNAKAAELAAASQLTSKEQKDKSNTLSKQNSAKSLGQSTPTQLPPLTPAAVPPSPSAVKEVNYPPVATPLRLEPISRPAMNPLAPLTPIRLESIFGPRREAALGSGSGSVAGDFIDPKLINACDNLHVSSGISSDASSTPQQLSQSRSRSSSQSTITHERRQSGEARNLLKRKMRLGRNQFLYDASPEDADASSGCSADDEANRSSMEYDEQCWQQQQKQLLANPLPLVMPMVHNAMPTFDDFDFEEFLSSFENENDDEQFPLFKDCREFLLNRSTSRQRSFQKATSTPQATATPSTPHTPHSIHSVQSKIKDNHAHRSEAKAPEERLQRQRSNASNASSQEEKQSRQDMEKRMGAEDQQKREIFISIETEANAQGRSPISPDSLRHMVGNAQTPIDVLHIENGNEPEHARFSKISDTEDAGDESGDRTSQATATGRLAPSPSGSALAPNVQLNNAKNLIQQMQSDFRQLGEEASASMRRMLIVSGRGDEQQQQQQQASREVRDPNPIPNLEQEQQHIKANAPLTPSPSAESDELSSLDGYPMSSSHGSRRGASSKMSTDSAYGSSNSPYSLSRQRSSELQPVASHSQGLQRPHTASAMLAGGLTDSSPQTHSAHGGLKARKRLFVPESGSNGDGAELSISGPDHFLQQHQQISNYNYQQLQQQQLQQQQQQLQQQQPQQQQEKPLPQSLQDYNANNNLPITPTISEHSLNSNESMSSSMRISKYCHECGGKFILDTAKFCMECGMKRIIF
ncbi:mediator of RNA polymerase II transcription subunit 12 isoform X2 [Drosophila ficusphila]|uniref:mediator of RNA polymerase II transcription subunit 12 isoform X2 n=1 Tax=Drosophila ficusphila TaxID=30025 RepID=UPI0007E88EF4|nr:mediator of RNA polymerase II transcription subunit 12 isoform X2 [Drosophila ficusphila]